MQQRIDNQTCYDGNIKEDQDDYTYEGANRYETEEMDHDRMRNRAWGWILVKRNPERKDVKPVPGGLTCGRVRCIGSGRSRNIIESHVRMSARTLSSNIRQMVLKYL